MRVVHSTIRVDQIASEIGVMYCIVGYLPNKVRSDSVHAKLYCNSVQGIINLHTILV